jgi:hypothetical protein
VKGRKEKTSRFSLALGLVAGFGVEMGSTQETQCVSPGRGEFVTEEDLTNLGDSSGAAAARLSRREISFQALAELAASDGADPVSAEALEVVLRDFAAIDLLETTRADMRARFRLDGGIYTAGEMRFLHPLCRYCKIDVLFEYERDPNSQCRGIIDGGDLVVDVSKPYVGRAATD